MSHAFETIPPGNRLEFDPDGVHDGNHGSCLDFKSRKRRTELVNGQRVVAVQQHIAAPVTHAHDEHLDLEVVWRLPWSEDLQDLTSDRANDL